MRINTVIRVIIIITTITGTLNSKKSRMMGKICTSMVVRDTRVTRVIKGN